MLLSMQHFFFFGFCFSFFFCYLTMASKREVQWLTLLGIAIDLYWIPTICFKQLIWLYTESYWHHYNGKKKIKAVSKSNLKNIKECTILGSPRNKDKGLKAAFCYQVYKIFSFKFTGLFSDCLREIHSSTDLLIAMVDFTFLRKQKKIEWA